MLFAVPLILAGFLSQAYSIIDTLIAGKILSYNGLAAIGSTSAFIQFFSSVFWGYGVGFSIYAAHLFGEKNYKKLKSAIYLNYAAIIAVIVVLSVAVIVSRGWIFNLLKIDETIRKDTSLYFCIYMAGIVFILMNSNFVYIMHALGSSTYPLIMSVISTLLHIVGNIAAVKYLNMGVGGIAVSTVLSAAIIDVLYILEIKKCFKQLGVDGYKVDFKFSKIRESFRYSLPTAMQQMLMYLSSVIISPMVNGIGTSASAAYAICLKIYDVNASVYQNSSKTLSNYTAQSLGAGKYENIRKGIKVGTLQGLLFSLPILIFSVIFAKQLCALFVPQGSTGDGYYMAVVFVRYFLPFIVLNLVNNLFHSFYRGVAAMKFLVIATFVGSVSRIAATYVCVKYLGMNGIYLGWVISWLIECIYTLTVYFTGVWKSEDIKNFELSK